MSKDGRQVLSHHPRCTEAQASVNEPWHFCQDCGEEAGATKERDELREQVAHVADSLEWIMRDRDCLRAALEKYGRHIDTCFPHIWPDAGCTCGLAEALEPKP